MFYHFKGVYVGRHGIYNTNPIKKENPRCTYTINFKFEGEDGISSETISERGKVENMREKASRRAHILEKRFGVEIVDIEEKIEW